MQLKNGQHLFSREKVLSLREQINNCLTLRDAAELLGISQYIFKKMVELKAIDALIQPDDKTRDWLFELRSLTELIDNLRKNAAITTIQPDSGTATQTSGIDGAKAWAFRGYSQAQLLIKMLRGEISYRHIGNSIYPMLLSQFQPFQTKTTIESEGYVLPKEMAALMKVNLNAVYEWMKSGAIECITIHPKTHTRPIKAIPKPAANAFNAKYISPREWAELMGYSIPKASRDLRARDPCPYFKSTNTSSVAVYSRAKVMAHTGRS